MPSEVTYNLGIDSPDGTLFESVSLLEIETTPVASDICNGGITYLVFYDGQEVTTTSSPVRRVDGIVDDKIQLFIFTDDVNDVGDHTVIVQAVQSGSIVPDNPSTNSDFASETKVVISNACLSVNSLTATS